MMVAIIVSAIFQAALGGEFYSQYAILMLVVIIGIFEWPQVCAHGAGLRWLKRKKSMLKRQG